MLYALVFVATTVAIMPDLRTCEIQMAITIAAYEKPGGLDGRVGCPDLTRLICQRRA